MGFIGSIISDLASIITIVTLWGISANSPLLLKIAVILVSVLLSVRIIVWHHRRKYKVKGYSRDKMIIVKWLTCLFPIVESFRWIRWLVYMYDMKRKLN